jgi:hypothetical membrane protein
MNQKELKNRQYASGILLFGIIQWILVVVISEGLQPNYISSVHYVSTLGTGYTASIYNISTVILGSCLCISTLFIRSFSSSRLFIGLLLIAGLATVGVGVFPEDSRPMHGIVTPIALIFAALSGMSTKKQLNKPVFIFVFSLGAISLLSGLIFIPYLGLPVESRAMYLGFYKGTLERIVIYTNLLWILLFGSQISVQPVSNNELNAKEMI